MKSWERVVLRLVALGVLYLFAAPVYAVLGAVRLSRLFQFFEVVRSGRVTCAHCGHDNALNRLATCNRCHGTEYGSVLFCSFCHQVSRHLSCEGCGVTLRVVPWGSL
jgi:hypothetical protein